MAAQAAALAQLVQGGVMSPDESRRTLGMGPADGGDQLFVQRQMVPVTLAAELAQAELDKLTAPPPPPPPPPMSPAPPPGAGEVPPSPAPAPAPAEPDPATARALFGQALRGLLKEAA